MAKNFEIKLPKLGESIVSATVVSIYKKEGDFIKKDEALMEVATDKVNSEIPTPIEGTIEKIFVKENEVVQVGDIIAEISSKEKKEEKIAVKTFQGEIKKEEKTDKKGIFSPAVLRFAKENDISITDLEKIKATGEGGRLTKKDIENFIKNSKTENLQKKDQNILDLTPIRKTIAKNMSKANQIPTAYLVEEIDITDLFSLITEKKKSFLEKYLAKLTITSFLAKAIFLACRKYPLANSYYLDDKIHRKNEINLAIAVNVEGDVLVPSLQNIQNLDFIDLVKQINILVKKAKNNQLTSQDIQNSTITLTNFGMTNISTGFPIINYPQASIIAAGAIKKKPWVKENQIQIRSIINITYGFDHRIFDGIYACSFLNEIKNYLENEFDKSF